MIDSIDPAIAALVEAWKSDREWRSRVPLREAWRGCMGFGALIDGAQRLLHGQRVLIPNDAVLWLALRDLPVGTYCKSMHSRYREANIAGIARAILRYGTPRISFGAEALFHCDFRRQPVGGAGEDLWQDRHPDALDGSEHPREFAAFNRLSQAMTRAAFFGVDDNGRPIRTTWTPHRPPGPGPRTEKAERLVSPSTWMPQPYLAFESDQLDDLYEAVTHLQTRGYSYPCACGAMIDAQLLRGAGGPIESVDVDRFRATCPACGARRVWSDGQTVEPQTTAWFSRVFIRRFCEAVAQQLPLRAPMTMTYCGAVDLKDRVPPGFRGHRFQGGGSDWIVCLPVDTLLCCSVGATIEAGSVWAQALPHVPPQWMRLSSPDKWKQVGQACGDAGRLALLRRLWFNHEVVRLEERPGFVFVPAAVAGPAAHEFRPAEVMWDFTPARSYIDEDGIAAFPPVRLRRWDDWVINAGDDLFIDASVSDPRLMESARSHRWCHTSPRAGATVKPPDSTIRRKAG